MDPESPLGYYIDFRAKTSTPDWPPDEVGPLGSHLWVVLAQWGLGCYERFLVEGDERWLRAASQAADHMLAHQETDGAWLHRFPYPHTFPLPAPWPSAMAQGEGASLLVRLARALDRGEYAEAAVRALKPMRTPTERGGVAARLGDSLFPEEYPTDPPSFVLNGGIFALWGLHDVGRALNDQDAQASFGEGADTLAANLHRWDTGRWSRYDLFPHPVVNVASSGYHALHINQLSAMEALAPRRELTRVRERFQAYAADPRKRAEAFARKASFRVLVPRSPRAARLLPWARRRT